MRNDRNPPPWLTTRVIYCDDNLEQMAKLPDEVCWAFAHGTCRMVTTPQGGGKQEATTGNRPDILRRQPDSSWKIARSTWSSDEWPAWPGGSI